MNERIKELAEKAGIAINQMVLDDVPYDYWEVSMDGTDDLEKFTEIVVRTCIKDLEEQMNRYLDPESYEDEKYYIQMAAKADAINDAISSLKYIFEIK